MNDLTTLNNTLFDTMNQLREGKIKREDAKVINEIAGTIISNAKVQIDAFKASKGLYLPSGVINIEKSDEPKALPGDVYAQKHEFAIFKGYKNVSEGIAGLGKNVFEAEFKLWIES
ncbi:MULTISPECIES: hypothetical protein [unclassified Myroides]|uniref:hypothetical protein n=1 Tax=unclassified Myroides TaxID=2642485 RepID=UPI003D2F7E6D